MINTQDNGFEEIPDQMFDKE